MKIFLDTADIDLIQKYNQLGIIDGVTTNPSIIANSGKKYFDIISEICKIIKGPVSAEVIATEYKSMLMQAHKILKVSDNIVIKLPITYDGIQACAALSSENIKTNMTLCFSESQALLAAKAGATFISPFIGRLDDIGQDGMELITNICNMLDNYDNLTSEVLVASVRNLKQVTDAAIIGADIVTIPPKIIDEMLRHHLTDKGLEKFLTDWNNTGQSI
jgi:transaldolase